MEYGDSVQAWCPILKTGDSGFMSGMDAAPISLHGVSKNMSFAYNPSETLVQDGYTEFIDVKFAQSVFPTRVEIGENRGMCSVVRILGRYSASNSEFRALWRSLQTRDERAQCEAEHSTKRQYKIFGQPQTTPLASVGNEAICEHAFRVDVLRIELDTRQSSDWNEIDYVQLYGHTEIPAGVLPVNTSGVYYVPDPGFNSTDSFTVVPYDCPWYDDRAGTPTDVTIRVAGEFPPPSPPPQVLIPVVRIGVLLPMLPWSPRVGAYQALRDLNDKSAAIAGGLLPNTYLNFSFKNSNCDASAARSAAQYLTQSAFEGLGVSAIIGAGCSGATLAAAQVASGARVPLISPSSTTPELSNTDKFPFFFRTCPSDAFISHGMVDVMKHLLTYSSVAM
eukprot:1660086-Prymnesium_polylepis.2